MFTVCSVQYAVCSMQFEVFSAQFTDCSVQFTEGIVQFVVGMVKGPKQTLNWSIMELNQDPWQTLGLTKTYINWHYQYIFSI